jgi:hypothetical protein
VVATNPDVKLALSLAFLIALVLASLQGLVLLSATAVAAVRAADFLAHIGAPPMLGLIVGALCAIMVFYGLCAAVAFIGIKAFKLLASKLTAT